MGGDLTTDEFDALAQIVAGIKHGERPSACVARNTKRLLGLKYIEYAKNGQLALTDKGKQTLFIKSCINGLRAIAIDPATVLKSDVQTFLGKKGHIAAKDGGYEITEKGRECLADIDARSK
jgi:predicted transcriptional regulator